MARSKSDEQTLPEIRGSMNIEEPADEFGRTRHRSDPEQVPQGSDPEAAQNRDPMTAQQDQRDAELRQATAQPAAAASPAAMSGTAATSIFDAAVESASAKMPAEERAAFWRYSATMRQAIEREVGARAAKQAEADREASQQQAATGMTVDQLQRREPRQRHMDQVMRHSPRT